MKFQFADDEDWFKELLFESQLSTNEFNSLFDFRDPSIKREEFSKLKRKIQKELEQLYGIKCMLSLDDECNIEDGINIDHLIPISSNILNIKIRKIKGENGKKTTTQSFGSNNILNLVICCKHCNGKKKHTFLNKEQYKRIFEEKRRTIAST